MYILAMRNDKGFLRVGPERLLTDNARKAISLCNMAARKHRRTVTIVDLSDVLRSYEPGGTKFDWRAAGWYCAHSYEYCPPCALGYDHPADVDLDFEAIAYAEEQKREAELTVKEANLRAWVLTLKGKQLAAICKKHNVSNRIPVTERRERLYAVMSSK